MPRTDHMTFDEQVYFKITRKGIPNRIRREVTRHMHYPHLPGTSEIIEHFMANNTETLKNTTYFRGKIYSPTVTHYHTQKLQVR